MAFNLASVLKLLPVVGPIVAATEEFRQIYDGIVETFDDDTDQQTLRDGLDDLIADNDEGNERLKMKLAEAARR